MFSSVLFFLFSSTVFADLNSVPRCPSGDVVLYQQVCQQLWQQYNCTEIAKDPKKNFKLRRCDQPDEEPTSGKVADFFKGCGEGAWDTFAGDTIHDLEDVLEDVRKTESEYRACGDTHCKTQMLGENAHYFSKSEIESLSASQLRWQLAARVTGDQSTLNDPFSSLWLDIKTPAQRAAAEAEAKASLNSQTSLSIKEKTLALAAEIDSHYQCYNFRYRRQLECYALANFIDPLKPLKAFKWRKLGIVGSKIDDLNRGYILSSHLSQIARLNCLDCPKELIVSKEIFDHFSRHTPSVNMREAFRHSLREPMGTFKISPELEKEVLELVKPPKTAQTVLPAGLNLDSIKFAASNPENITAELLNHSADHAKRVKFKVKLGPNKEEYVFVAAICKTEFCVQNGVRHKKNEVIGLFPVCGPRALDFGVIVVNGQRRAQVRDAKCSSKGN